MSTLSTLTEIEAAATRLSTDEKRALLRFLIESLPHPLPTPEPRDIPVEEIRAWLDEDQREFRELLASGKLKR